MEVLCRAKLFLQSSVTDTNKALLIENERNIKLPELSSISINISHQAELDHLDQGLEEKLEL